MKEYITHKYNESIKEYLLKDNYFTIAQLYNIMIRCESINELEKQINLEYYKK